MHACGHDGHTTILLGAARVLSKLRGELSRPVKLLFQPAEEMECGAERMLEAGALDERTGGIRSEMVFGLHGWPSLPLGAIGFREGPMMASMHRFRLVVSGKGGHASAPQDAQDSVLAAAQIIVASQSIVSRNLSPLESAVLTIASIHAGEADNVIPSSAVLAGTIRALDDGVASRVHHRLAEIAELTAKAHGCSASVEIRDCCPVTMNHGQAVAFLAEKLGRAFGPGRLISLDSPVMGSEDFAFYGRRVPSCYFFLGLRPPDRPDFPRLHTAEFDFNDEALRAGVEAFARLAL
jgi:amidohydrolase